MTMTDTQRTTVATPAGFEIPAATYLAAMEGIGIRRALAAPPPTSAAGVDIAASSIAAHRRGLVRDLKMPRWFRAELVGAYRRLGDRRRVCVRRAGAADGQVVVGEGALITAVVDVWASLWSEATCTEQLRDPEAGQPSVAVVVELAGRA